MTCTQRIITTLLVLLFALPLHADEPRTMAAVLESSKPADWRRLEQERLLYLMLPAGQVVFELAPQFAPRHLENLKKLVLQQLLHQQRSQWQLPLLLFPRL